MGRQPPESNHGGFEQRRSSRCRFQNETERGVSFAALQRRLTAELGVFNRRNRFSTLHGSDFTTLFNHRRLCFLHPIVRPRRHSTYRRVIEKFKRDFIVVRQGKKKLTKKTLYPFIRSCPGPELSVSCVPSAVWKARTRSMRCQSL